MWKGKLEFVQETPGPEHGFATELDFEKAVHFNAREFACRGCGKVMLGAAVLTGLDILRTQVGQPLVVSSGFRCKEHNALIGGKAHSAHVHGLAVDLRVYGELALDVVQGALHLFKGVGVSQAGEWNRRFVHLDRIDDHSAWNPEFQPRPWLWGYKHRKALG